MKVTSRKIYQQKTLNSLIKGLQPHQERPR